jgi:hypothetical protein
MASLGDETDLATYIKINPIRLSQRKGISLETKIRDAHLSSYSSSYFLSDPQTLRFTATDKKKKKKNIFFYFKLLTFSLPTQ